MNTSKKLFSCGDQQFGWGSQYPSQYLSPETVLCCNGCRLVSAQYFPHILLFIVTSALLHFIFFVPSFSIRSFIPVFLHH
jgi:hypothetical protein